MGISDSTIIRGRKSVGDGKASERIEVAHTLATGETDTRLKVA